MAKLLQTLALINQKLNGKKTFIGLSLLNIEARLNLPDIWWADLLLATLLAWTGVGIGHKTQKAKLWTKMKLKARR